MFKNFKEIFEKFFVLSFLFGIGTVIFLSLATHYDIDNNFFQFDSNVVENKNLLGSFGAVLSSFLFDIFGIIAFVIPIFFIYHSLSRIIGKKIMWYNWSLLPFLLIFCCILIEFISQNYLNDPLEGGLLGLGIYNYLNYLLEDFVDLKEYLSFY